MSMKKEMSLEELKQIVGGVEDPIVSMTVSWEDANGNKYSYTVGGEKKKPYDPIVSQTVTWEDGNGNTYSNTYAN
ncbi:MAG: bacteriocin [Clostridia bacterium]|nr:bacteriocin [Clostridia bacterium]